MKVTTVLALLAFSLTVNAQMNDGSGSSSSSGQPLKSSSGNGSFGGNGEGSPTGMGSAFQPSNGSPMDSNGNGKGGGGSTPTRMGSSFSSGGSSFGNNNGSNSGSSDYGSQNGRMNGQNGRPSAPLWSEKGLCPFRSNNTEVLQAWEEAKNRITSLTTNDSNCKAALDSFKQGLSNQQAIADSLIDPVLSAQAQLDEVDRRLLYLQSTTPNPESCASFTSSTTITGLSDGSYSDISGDQPATSVSGATSTQITYQRTCSEMDTLIARQTSLRAQISQASNDRNASEQNRARTQTFTQVKAAIDSIPNLSRACEGAEPNILGTIGSASMNLFATAQPLIMGANAGVSAVASILSSLVGAFRGKTTAEKAADFMQNAGDLRNLSCFYFAVMRLQCNIQRGPKADESGSDIEVLEDIRQLFESDRNGALGKRMRALFEGTFGDHKQELGPEKTRRIPQYCALMTNIPGRNDRCNATARVGTAMSDCTYMDYFERGTNLPGYKANFPAAAPGGALSTPRAVR